jgi:opacity protein-like surface antigen
MKSIITYAVMALAILAFSTVSVSQTAHAADGLYAWSDDANLKDASGNSVDPMKITDDGHEAFGYDATFTADKGRELCDDSHYVCILDTGSDRG